MSKRSRCKKLARTSGFNEMNLHVIVRPSLTYHVENFMAYSQRVTATTFEENTAFYID